MIIECICGKKKFEVNSDLIPSTGRLIQCGSCEKVWFFDPNKESLKINEELETNISEPVVKQKTKEIKPKKETVPPKKGKRKTKRYAQEAYTFIKNQDKWEAANQYAEHKGWKFQVWTEDTLKGLGIKLLKS